MSVHVYDVPAGEPVSRAFHVRADDRAVPVLEMQVSALPFNRRWPGHQRSEDQRETAYFVSFDMDGPVTIVVEPARPFQNVVIRPASAKIQPAVLDGVITFEISGFGGYTVELDGYHQALHIFTNPFKSYAVDLDDENTLYYGAGVHDVGVIDLKSNQTVFIDEGAVVYARIFARNADNIRILGRGILDNSRNKEEILFDLDELGKGDTAVNNAVRIHTIRLEACHHIEIDGITIRDSLVYNIAPYACTDLLIDNVKIIGCWRYNSDGINMHACSRCRIRNCFIRTYDDSICVKGLDQTYDGANPELCEDIVVDNCVIWNDWGKCLEIGAEANAEIMHDITFRNCSIIHCTSAVLDAFNVDYADVHDVVYEHIDVEYDPVFQRPQIQESDSGLFVVDPESTYLPSLLSTCVTKHHEYSHGAERRGKIHNITFRDIRVTASRMPPSWFVGYDEQHQSSDIRIIDLFLNGEKVTTLEQANVRIGDFAGNITIE